MDLNESFERLLLESDDDDADRLNESDDVEEAVVRNGNISENEDSENGKKNFFQKILF